MDFSLLKSYTEKNRSLNFTELFKNCGYRYLGNEVKENLYKFL